MELFQNQHSSMFNLLRTNWWNYTDENFYLCYYQRTGKDCTEIDQIHENKSDSM